MTLRSLIAATPFAVQAGTLYGVGVGPGAPDLITLRAAQVIGGVDAIAVPVARRGEASYALTIARGLVGPEQEVIALHFPMVRDVAHRIGYRREAAAQIAARLTAGRSVAFLTEGDPLLHSTFGYVLAHLPEGLPVEVVPGVSSINAAAALTGEPLVKGEDRLAVLPATFENVAALDDLFAEFDTVVLMKVHRVLGDLLDALDRLGLTEGTWLVERASHPAGRVLRGAAIRGSDPHYLSLLIVHTGRSGDAG
jgi:precorrin-2/cobalt-factor-2 C20-methyltransferase